MMLLLKAKHFKPSPLLSKLLLQTRILISVTEMQWQGMKSREEFLPMTSFAQLTKVSL